MNALEALHLTAFVAFMVAAMGATFCAGGLYESRRHYRALAEMAKEELDTARKAKVLYEAERERAETYSRAIERRIK